ncbi:PAS domain S-box-containing protein [Filomicrobium insigne]|uniref:Blue-light-activated histidine kinase n=1 Tax=Filomicrobium insigne TaxID=418854 RepID=A0A1H0SJZ4_9HYPH|nr:HWE histidine kinase domain-containing protein [Filomicrobium insigne]SDP41995.1 PAS domain S-box-containing protein [Filomicrobium insigne]
MKTADRTRWRTSVLEMFAAGSWLDLLPIGIYVCDKDGCVLQFNAHAARLWGRKPALKDPSERFSGSYRLFRTEDGSRMTPEDTPMAEVLRTGVGVRDKTVEIERPDGTRITVLANIEPVFDDDGNLEGAINSFQDISELKRALERVELSEKKLHAVFDALPAAVYTTDTDGKLTFYNKASVEMVGREPRLGEDQWCCSSKLFSPDGSAMSHDEYPMAVALHEKRPLTEAEVIIERPDGEQVPILAYTTPIFDAVGRLTGGVNVLVDITERKKAQEAQSFLIDELNHRVKNTLATVQSIAGQSFKSATSPADFVEKFSGRVQSLANTHTILTQETWRGAELGRLIGGQVILHEADRARVDTSGPSVTLAAQPALHLALLLHELAANARRYGALSVSEGRLDLTWRVDGDASPILILDWQESGGPPVVTPATRGFGSTLIESGLAAYGGMAELRFEAEGFGCRISLPLTGLSVPARKDVEIDNGFSRSIAAVAVGQSEVSDMAGTRVLVVEDEPLVAIDIEDCLKEAGCSVLGPAANAEQAMRLIKNETFDIALMDANLAGTRVDELAQTLKARGIPFAFVSGYGREGLPAGFQEALLVSKPFNSRQLIGAVESLRERLAEGTERPA